MLTPFRFRLLIVSMVLALLGLIAIQIHWVKNAIALENSRFETTVQQALRSVADQVEKREVASNVRKRFDLSSQGRTFFIGVDSIISKTISRRDTSTSGLLFWNEISPGELQTEFRLITQDGSIEVIEEAQTDSSGEVTLKKIRSASIRSNDLQPLGDVQVKVEEKQKQKDQRLERFLKKSGMVSDIFKELFNLNLYKGVEDRVKPGMVDSLLKVEFANAGVDLAYHYGIYDLSNNRLFFNRENTSPSELMKSPFKVRLFPHDIFVHPDYLMVYFPDQGKFVLSNLWIMFITSGVLILILILAFYVTISTILRQKRISEIKNDFINNMTHELKTPISTISLAVEALQDPDMSRSETLSKRYAGIIQEENQRIELLVDQVLQAAQLEKDNFLLKKQATDLHQLIEQVLHSFALKKEEIGADISTRFCQQTLMPEIDPVHFSNVIYNLVDNALKYSKQKVKVEIDTSFENDIIQIGIKDNGIGIARDQHKKIFEKLYRIPSGNLHNVKGYGLGLSYVKQVVEKHGGMVHIESESGKGSYFTIRMPYQKNNISSTTDTQKQWSI